MEVAACGRKALAYCALGMEVTKAWPCVMPFLLITGPLFGPLGKKRRYVTVPQGMH